MPYAQIAGWGMCVPSKVLTNDDLVKAGLNTSDEWITSRTGIKQRHVVSAGEATSDLALKAAQRALAKANADPREIDLVVVATSTPDHVLPSTASLVQDRLGAFRAGALDVNAACAGFVYALTLATGQIESGRCKQALVIGADALSLYVNWKDRSTCVLFGDGAGAVLLRSGEEPGVLATSLGSDGSGAGLLIVPAGGSRHPSTNDSLRNGNHYLSMNGPQVFRFATQIMGRDAERVMAASGIGPDDVDLFVPHQANLRIIETAAKRLKLAPNKVFTNVSEYGNTSAASIPIALCEAIDEGRLKEGDHMVLSSFGAGLAWASAVVRWGTPQPVQLTAAGRLRRAVGLRTLRARSRLRRTLGRVRGLFARS